MLKLAGSICSATATTIRTSALTHIQLYNTVALFGQDLVTTVSLTLNTPAPCA